MKTPIVSALAAAVALCAVACSPAMVKPESVVLTESPSPPDPPVTVTVTPANNLTWREPIAASEHPADAQIASNMLVSRRVRMALPEGWHFKQTKSEDPKDVHLWIHDTGGNAVSGAFMFKHFDFPIAPTKATEFYADKAMDGYRQKEAHRTEIDGNEAHLVLGVKEETSQQRVSALIYEGTSNISDITLILDRGYFAQHPGIAFAIANSYRWMPAKMSERRIKGSFSFKSDDGSLEWLDDSTRKWQTNGFSVIGKVGGESVILEVSQVSTTRFQDFFKLERFQAAEIATELHLAGKTFAARAIVSEGREGKNAQAVFMFKHQGKDYMLDIFRVLSEHDAADARSLHNDKAIRHALDTSFYLAD